jgi:hypothetical protein
LESFLVQTPANARKHFGAFRLFFAPRFHVSNTIVLISAPENTGKRLPESELARSVYGHGEEGRA